MLADLVLAPFTAALHVHLLDERAVDPEALRAEVTRFARLLAQGTSSIAGSAKGARERTAGSVVPGAARAASSAARWAAARSRG